jgi:hypothetical protein
MQPVLSEGCALVLIALCLAASAVLRPWRQLQGGRLATPLLALLTLLPWLWSWPGLAAQPLPLHWSAAPLAVLLVGWPLAVPLLVFAGLATMLITGASVAQALASIAWYGLLPATATLLLGHGVRRSFGTHPVAYLLGRAFLVPFAALLACGLVAAAAGPALPGGSGEMKAVVALLLAMGEAAWTCAIASLLVAYKPQWLATWSDALYLPRPARARGQASKRRT